MQGNGRGPRACLLRLHGGRHLAVGVAGKAAGHPLGPARLRDRRHAVRALPDLHRAVHPERHLPVVHDGRPVGILSVKRIVHYLVEHYPITVYNLPPVSDAYPHEAEGA